MRVTLSLLLFTFLLSACSQTATVEEGNALDAFLNESELQQSGTTERIVNFTIDSWEYIDPHHLMIKTRPKEKYLVSLRKQCRGLDSVITIGTTSSGGALTKFDKVVFEDSFVGRQECIIDNIVKLEAVNSSE